MQADDGRSIDHHRAASRVLLVDRHIEKNGGTSARWLMHRAELHGHCAYWGYENLGGIVKVLTEKARSPWPPLCIEAHTSVNHASIRHLRDLCARLRWRCVFWLRWRRPLMHYLSFFRWGTLGSLALSSPEEAAPLFLEWVHENRDLQARIMLDSSAATRALTWRSSKAASSMAACANLKGCAQQPPVDSSTVYMVLDYYNALGTTDGLPDSLRTVGQLLGWPASLINLTGVPDVVLGKTPTGCRRREASRWWCFNASLPAASEYARVTRAICPSMEACARAVEQAAPLDAAIYERAASGARRKDAATSHSAGELTPGQNQTTRRTCAWRALCHGKGCTRERSSDMMSRTAVAPLFTRNSSSCYTGDRDVLARAWADHPQGGRVFLWRPFGRLVRAQDSRGGGGRVAESGRRSVLTLR